MRHDVFDPDRLVADCLDAVRREDDVPRAVHEIVDRAVSEPRLIEAAVGSASNAPLLSTWYNSDQLTVLHIVWPPEVDMFAHDHGMWAVIGLYGGREANRFFRPRPDETLEASGDTTLRPRDVATLDDGAVHAVANPTREWTAAIHVYGGDFFRPGRRMWPDPDAPPIPYDKDRAMSILGAAAERARSTSRST